MKRGIEQQPLAHEFGEILSVSWVIFTKIEKPLRPEVLVGERVMGGHTFPGGKIEVGQTKSEAAIAESFQEVGLTVSEDDMVPMKGVEFGIRGRLVYAHPYLAFFDGAVDESSPKTKEPEKHLDWRWADLNEIASLISQGELPLSVWDEKGWLDLVKEAAFLEWGGEDLEPPKILAAGIFEECHEYKVQGMWERFDHLYMR